MDTNVMKFNHKFDECVSVSGDVDWGRKLMNFDSLDIKYNATTIIYWKRKHPILWFLSKKEYYPETMNNCNGETTITEIDIIKKKNIFE